MQAAPGHLQPKDSRRWRPRIIRRLKRAAQRVERGQLELVDLAEVPAYYGGAAHVRRRDLRVERRRAIGAFLVVVSEYISASSRILFHDQDGIHGVRLTTLADQAQLCPRRVDRCVRNLRDAGYLVSAERCEYDPKTDGYKGFAAVRQFTHKLIEHLGLAREWAKASQHHYRRQKALQAQRRSQARDDLADLRHHARGQSAPNARTEPRQLGQALVSALAPPD